jgi:3-phenylpropionate/trans-cinnamate dioxygenase ferredoxin subunit
LTHYYTVGRQEDFPKGSLRAFAIGDDEVVVCNTGRSFYAVRNVCSHRAERLSDGLVEDENLVCAYHEAVYELATGRPIEGPAFDPVETFPVRVQDGEVQVGSSSEVDPSAILEVKHEAGLVGD